jgi:hypothetical protein
VSGDEIDDLIEDLVDVLDELQRAPTEAEWQRLLSPWSPGARFAAHGRFRAAKAAIAWARRSPPWHAHSPRTLLLPATLAHRLALVLRQGKLPFAWIHAIDLTTF